MIKSKSLLTLSSLVRIFLSPSFLSLLANYYRLLLHWHHSPLSLNRTSLLVLVVSDDFNLIVLEFSRLEILSEEDI